MSNEKEVKKLDEFGELGQPVTGEGKETSKPDPDPNGVLPPDGKEEKVEKKERKVGKQKKDKEVMTPRDKVLRKMMKRAGLDDLPKIEYLLRGKSGERVAIADISLFTGKVTNPVLKELAEACPNLNRVNFSAEVLLNQVIAVGTDILQRGRMYTPIQVVKTNDGKLECTSGRHRLAFLALTYGASQTVPVYMEEMTLDEARDAVVVANQARKAQAMERAEHLCIGSVGGKIDAEQDELYAKIAKTKAKVVQYATYCVFNRNYPAKMTFKVSTTSSRKNGEATTIKNVQGFWSSAIEWTKEMARAEFDRKLKEAIRFLNAYVKAAEGVVGFNEEQHLASKPLIAVGKYFREYNSVTGKSAIDVVDQIAKTIVEMGDIGRQKSEKTHAVLSKIMQK